MKQLKLALILLCLSLLGCNPGATQVNFTSSPTFNFDNRLPAAVTPIPAMNSTLTPTFSDLITIRGVHIQQREDVLFRGESSLPDGTCILTQLYEDEQPLAWWPSERCALVKFGRWEIYVRLSEEQGAPEGLVETEMYILRAWQKDNPSIEAQYFPFDLQGPPAESTPLTPAPTSTPSPTPTPSPSPTPLFVFDLSGYDPDLFQPIDLMHVPPMIAQADETVRLAFEVVNTIYCAELQRYCRIEPRLYFTYGDDEAFQSMPLSTENVNGMEPLVARLPATDQTERPVRYYAEFVVPEAGYTLRYPAAGKIDLFATTNFISIELPAENEVQPGEVVYNFLWGYGEDKVRQATFEGYARRIGPPAVDVAKDGRIALLDPVNERVLIYNPNEDSYASFKMPFTNNNNADLAFDQNGQLMICDFAGEYIEGTPPTPYCYRLHSDGELDAEAPVYAKFPMKITGDNQVLDYFDYRLVAPFNTQGEANSSEAQRQKETWDLPYRFVEGEQGLDPFKDRFADIKEGIAFEVHAEAGLGVILGFEKTPQGYLMLYSGDEQIRAVWIDAAGGILKDVTLPNGQYSELSLGGQVAAGEGGSLYVLSSTERGIEVHLEGAP